MPSETPTETAIPTETPTLDPSITMTETTPETETPTETETSTMTEIVVGTETPTTEASFTETETPASTSETTATETATPTETASPTATATSVVSDTALYYYDGSGTMVKSVINEVVTYYASGAYQYKTDGTHENTRKYYNFGNTTVAMRENDVVTWQLTDQINSTTVTTSADGTLTSEVRYTAFGEIREGNNGVTVTDNKYTGQREEVEIGLDYYVARWYDPALAHFIQADTVVANAGSILSFLKYAYVDFNPIRLSDPTGHYGYEGGYGSRVIKSYQPWWVPAVSKISESLISISDPKRNPRTATFNKSFWGGINAWKGVASMSTTIVNYTSSAIKEQRWEDASRGAAGICKGAQTLTLVPVTVGYEMVSGLVSTPVRIFTNDIPEFVNAINERQQGQDRFWDVLFTGANLSGDITALYGLGKGAAQVENFARSGYEIKLSDNVRIAPFGNRTGNPLGELPHYHRRGIDSFGDTIPGQGIGRHRPWQIMSPDKSFWDRW